VVYHAECMQGPGGLKWHKICFRCTSCSKQVDSLTSCVTTDDVLMCKTCYSKQRGPVGYGYGGALASETQGKA
jgi:cysteine/glycine-rich protein